MSYKKPRTWHAKFTDSEIEGFQNKSKTCPRCGLEKDIINGFGLRHEKRTSGIKIYPRNYCFECLWRHSIPYKERYYERHPEKKKEAFEALHQRRLADPQWHNSVCRRWEQEHPEEAKIIKRRSQKKCRKQSPQKNLARIVARVIHPIRQECSIDGCRALGERHHPNYSESENIIWLCREHHLDYHRKDKE